METLLSITKKVGQEVYAEKNYTYMCMFMHFLAPECRMES
jgi:hypothetical protein